MILRIQRHKSFDELRIAWQALESKAQCSVFTGWQWQRLWWQTWGAGLELQLYSFRTDDDTVVGIAPFFIRRYRFKRLVPLRQLQPIGNLYPGDETVLSEYLDLVVDPAFADATQATLLVLLKQLRWDELVLPMITRDSHFYRALCNQTEFAVTPRQEGAGICVPVTGTFADYLAGLGKNTRLKLYNRRTLLNQVGTVELTYAETPEDAEALLQELNQLASTRWGKPPFGNKSLAFHQQLSQEACDSHTLRLSRLSVNGITISLLYNLRFGSVEFNIQAAYDENFHGKISAGTLHLGYALEQACDDPGIKQFDLLFGDGKNAFYKRHFNGETTEFFTLLVARSLTARLLTWALQLYRKLRSTRQARKEPVIETAHEI